MEACQKLVQSFRGRELYEESEGSDDDSRNESPDFEKFNSLNSSGNANTPQIDPSELREVLFELKEIILCLYECSVIIQRSTPRRDLRLKAAKTDVSHYEPYDISGDDDGQSSSEEPRSGLSFGPPPSSRLNNDDQGIDEEPTPNISAGLPPSSASDDLDYQPHYEESTSGKSADIQPLSSRVNDDGQGPEKEPESKMSSSVPLKAEGGFGRGGSGMSPLARITIPDDVVVGTYPVKFSMKCFLALTNDADKTWDYLRAKMHQFEYAIVITNKNLEGAKRFNVDGEIVKLTEQLEEEEKNSAFYSKAFRIYSFKHHPELRKELLRTFSQEEIDEYIKELEEEQKKLDGFNEFRLPEAQPVQRKQPPGRRNSHSGSKLMTSRH